MTGTRGRTEIPGSAPLPLPECSPRSELPDPDERIAVTAVMRSRTGRDGLGEALENLSRQPPAERRYLPAAKLARRYGSARKDLNRVRDFAAGHGLEVRAVHPDGRSLDLSGSLAAFGRAFGVRFQLHDSVRGVCRTHDGPLRIPRELSGVLESVLGLDGRPLLEPAAAGGGLSGLAFTDPRTVAEHYRFPSDATGAGECVAVLQFGGGYHRSDLDSYFRLRGLPAPETALIELDGQTNQPADRRTLLGNAISLGLVEALEEGSPDRFPPGIFWATLECAMDLQILGTLAPGARLVTYMAPNSPRGKYLAFSRAIFDGGHRPSVINCSWGSCENRTPPDAMSVLDQLFQQAAIRGVTICASSGDFGDGAPICGEPTGHFPATSPYVLACGGSSLAADLSREAFWSETLAGIHMAGGGGYSTVFGRPGWQETGAAGRGFPDVVAKADLQAGFDVVVDDLDLPMGGTSAATVLWSALVARINEKLERPAGFFAPLLYTPRFAAALRALPEGAPWNPQTGLGSPVGTALLAALSGAR